LSKEYGHQKYVLKISAKGCKHETYQAWLDTKTLKEQKENYSTLGDAIYILAQKKCRELADWLIAIRGLLSYEDTPDQNMKEKFGTATNYLAIATQALKRGDYTPLLFTPIPNNLEQRIPGFAWLHGHSNMHEKLRDFGMKY
jgi:hypothetical protein